MNLQTDISRWLDLKAKTAETYSEDAMKSDIEALFTQSQKIKKELTQWDFYHVASVVISEDEYEAKISALLPNTAAIINTDSFIYNINGIDQTLSRGDIVYKNNELDTTLVKAERGGNFYPSKIVKDSSNNNLTITYTFTNAEPTGSENATHEEGSNVWTVDTPKKDITFNEIPISETKYIYGYVYTRDDTTIEFSTIFAAKIAVDLVTVIRPVIKMFDSNNEEVYCEYTLSLENKVYTLTLTNSLVNTIIVK